MNFELKTLNAFCSDCLVANLTYHRERTRLFDALTASHKAAFDVDEKDIVKIPLRDYLSLKQFLTSRSQKIQENDAMSLQFQKTLESVCEKLQPVDVVAEVEDRKDVPRPPDSPASPSKPSSKGS
jgi:hypothetical protein